MKVLMLSHSNGGGGAGRATQRLFEALDPTGLDLRMHVDFRDQADPRVFRNSSPLADIARRMRITIDEIPGVLARHPDPGLFSPATMSAISARRIDAFGADIVDVHWMNFGYLSVRTLGLITSPVAWHLHDMWAFTGGQNYAPDGPDARWRTGYSTPSDLSMRWDVERWVYRRKQRQWRTPRTLITSSTWMASLAQASPLTAAWPVHVIPNPVNTEIYSPGEMDAARAKLNLPMSAPLVVVLLPAALDDPRKGFDLLKKALARLAQDSTDIHLAVVGHSAPPVGWSLPLTTHWLGRQDDLGCVAAYRAADVVVVPSRQDNSPQTATEALSCGTPVVAFDTTGLPDFVTHQVNGYLARPEDDADLAAGIDWVLADPARRAGLGDAAREAAVARWSPHVVAHRHVDLYESVIARSR